MVIPPTFGGELAEEIGGVAFAGKGGEAGEFADILSQRIRPDSKSLISPEGEKSKNPNPKSQISEAFEGGDIGAE